MATAEELFNEHGLPYKEGYELRVTADLPEKASFPLIMIQLAVLKDLLDLPINLTLIFAFLTSVLSIFLGIVIWIWLLGKLSFWQKRFLRWAIPRFLGVLFLEFIPGLNIIPMATIFVLLAHNREKKEVQAFWKLVRELEVADLIQTPTRTRATSGL